MSVVVQTQVVETDTAADDPLLSYTVTTTPSPLKASPENPQAPEETGEVVISGARQSGTPADVEWIKVKVPAGTMAPDLATDLAKISPRVSLNGWTVRLDADAKEFVFQPDASHAPIGPDTGFTLQLSDIPISRKVGTAPITVTERSRTGTSAFQDRTTVFHLGKFPADFYLRNFLCEPSIIANGGDVKLTWERSANATYELLYGDINRDVTNRTSLDIEGIKSDTTFYLRATTGDPTNPVVRILSAQVSVLKPDLEIGSLIVNGTVDLKSTLKVAGETDFNANIRANAHVTVTNGNTLRTRHIRGLVNEQLTIDADKNGVSIGDPLTAPRVDALDALSAGITTASTNMEAKPGHGVERALDGRDDTYFLSSNRPKTGDWFMVDLKESRRITKIEIHFKSGDNTGGYLLEGEVQTSTDGRQWDPQGTCSMVPAYSLTPSHELRARYVRVLATKDNRLVLLVVGKFAVTPDSPAFTAPAGAY
ncbi:discoidin domain-containing protein [Streptomyces sp. NPDC050448]|uniref:discoidin domain-containing protein n=1 Tax=Streptomyces sp. NPDC050448 TaxID=3155404 RepID=UPI00341E514B